MYKKLFAVKSLLVAVGSGKTMDSPVRNIAVCAGSGSSVLRNPTAATADLFVTGEMSHHDRLEATERGISLILPGHTRTERGFLQTHLVPELQTLIQKSQTTPVGDTEVKVIMSKKDVEPGEII